MKLHINPSIKQCIFVAWALLLSYSVHAHRVHDAQTLKSHLQSQQAQAAESYHDMKAADPFFRKLFEPMDAMMPTPGKYRTANGVPGNEYWENRADYDISVTLNEAKNSIEGKVAIRYHNNSPQPLPFLWLQVDQQGLQHDNAFHNGNIAQNKQPERRNDPGTGQAALNLDSLKLLLAKQQHGFNIKSVTNTAGASLEHFIQGSNMRVDLASPLLPGQSAVLHIEYQYFIPNASYNLQSPARTGFEVYPDGSKAFYVMQFYPRLAYYDQSAGWDVGQYLGKGEFNLHFGDFDMRISVPQNHFVGATGELQNPKEALSSKYYNRLLRAQKSNGKPVEIVTKKEAVVNRKNTTKKMRTWHFAAKNVRDVAFVSSKRFMWHSMEGKASHESKRSVQIHSFFHPENDAFPALASLAAAQHTIDVYSKFTFDYPYPVMNVVEGAELGMEYPMLATYHFKQNQDNTYSRQAYGNALLTLIHEVGHTYVPMIVSSNERKWAWLDEGLNTFLHTQAMMSWSKMGEFDGFSGLLLGQMATTFPDRRSLMELPDDYRDSIGYFTTQYAIPALGLNVLRETILGREVFDKAFKGYFQAWKFKHPEPYDFFRYMEKASGRELQWFWRGWFYSTGSVDLAIDQAKIYNIQQLTESDHKASITEAIQNPASDFNRFITIVRDKGQSTVVERNPKLAGFYDKAADGKINWV